MAPVGLARQLQPGSNMMSSNDPKSPEAPLPNPDPDRKEPAGPPPEHPAGEPPKMPDEIPERRRPGGMPEIDEPPPEPPAAPIGDPSLPDIRARAYDAASTELRG